MHQILEALVRHVQTRPEAVAFVDDNSSITWRELGARISGLAARLDQTNGAVAIGLAGGIDYVVADLATSLCARRQVPLPFFFSSEQNAHILQDAGVGVVVTNTPGLFAALPHVTCVDPVQSSAHAVGTLRRYAGGAERVIYTSGSSGRPKGVIIGDRQLAASVTALQNVVAATPQDTHLSVLPLAQLLEQICGIFLPIVSGAKTVFRFAATQALFGAPVAPLLEAFEEVAPTTSLLAPALLGRWADALHRSGRRAPPSLRFVAVGGAATPPALIATAQRAGIPVHEGYGLSECCAVVAMNRPGNNVAGTVGPVLSGVEVTLRDGEITVSGPTVMQGYLNGPAAPEAWHTGDLGHFEDGRLVIDGRKDALLVTGAGRNISPEWVEQRVNADPRVAASALGLRTADGALVLIVAAMQVIPTDDIFALLGDLPKYAHPSVVLLTRPDEPGLLFPAGTPNRTVAAALINRRSGLPLMQKQEVTTS